MWQLVITTFEMGFLYALLVIATWITTTLLRYDDLSLEATFGLGGAVQARLLLLGLSPIVSLPLIMLAGTLSGLLTGILHTVLGLNNLLTGVIIITAFFSINMFIGTVNMPVLEYGSIFNKLPAIIMPFLPNINLTTFIILLVLPLLFIAAISWLLNTQIGFVMRATGANQCLVTGLGKSPRLYFIGTLMLAHSVTALAGALFVQYTGFFSLWSSTGILVIALAGLMIAQTLSSRLGAELIIGACIYQAIIATSLNLQVPPEWGRFVTAVLLILLMTMQRNSHVKT